MPESERAELSVKRQVARAHRTQFVTWAKRSLAVFRGTTVSASRQVIGDARVQNDGTRPVCRMAVVQFTSQRKAQRIDVVPGSTNVLAARLVLP